MPAPLAQPASSAAAFGLWCAFLTLVEGGYSSDPGDPGNWTGGKPGVGVLKGTKYGISAAAHPDLNIAEVTLDQANVLRKLEYWDKVAGDRLPSPIAFITADAAYGSGPAVAAKELQAIVGVAADGAIGPLTIAAVVKAIAKPSSYPACTGLDDLIEEYSVRRIIFEIGLPIWETNRAGWTRRLFRSAAIARSLA